MAVDATFDLLGLVTLDVKGFAEASIPTAWCSRVDVYAEFGFPPVFDAKGTLELRLNTTHQPAHVATGFGTINGRAISAST